jgi:DNA recombination protein RmuC
VVRLGNKSYWQHFQPAPDIVVMFVPGEALLSTALQADGGLLEFSMAKGVMLASPLTLIALLRAITYGWQQETIARNAMEISDLGRQLYDRIAKLAEHWEGVGKSLAKAVQAYNGAVGTLETRVLVTARRLKDKGVAAGEDMPDLEVIDQMPRALGAPQLTGLFDDTSEPVPEPDIDVAVK